MNEKVLIVMWNYKSIGGIESMILRMAQYAFKNHIKFLFATNDIDSLNETEYYDELKRNNAMIIEHEKIIKTSVSSLKNHKKYIIKKNQRVFILVFDYYEYFIAQKIKEKNNNIEIFLYIVHPFLHTCKDIKVPKKNKFAKLTCYKLYKQLLLKLYKNGSLLFMDEDCIKYNEKHFNVKLPKSYSNIIRLPIKIEKEEKRKLKSSEFNILSIARHVFPFKGYLIGLLKDFVLLKRKYPKLSLTIIGDGKDKEELVCLLDDYEDYIKKDIHLIGSIPYFNLKRYFEKANIYIGMGTTLLDAAKYSVPSITVYSYTYEFFAVDYFHENPHILGGFQENEENYGTVKKQGKDLLEKVVQMSSSEYQNLCKKSYAAVNKNYNIDGVMKKIFCDHNEKGKINVVLIMIMCFLERMKPRIKKLVKTKYEQI